MQPDLHTPLLALEAGEVVSLDDAQGTRIVARSGTVWVTEEGESLDHIVGPGDALVVARSGRTVVQALRSAWISIVDGRAADAMERPESPAEMLPRFSASAACDEARSRGAYRVPYY
jgi:hypothetical protein